MATSNAELALLLSARGRSRRFLGFGHFLVSDDETQYSSFSLWESKSDADAAGAAISEKTAGTLHELALEAPEIRIYEVYKPKG